MLPRTSLRFAYQDSWFSSFAVEGDIFKYFHVSMLRNLRSITMHPVAQIFSGKKIRIIAISSEKEMRASDLFKRISHP